MNSKSDLLSKQFIEFYESNRLLQHVLAFMTLMVIALTIAVNRDYQSILETIFYAAITYCFFLFSTKLDLHWFLILFMVIVAGFIHDIMVQYHNYNIIRDDNIDIETRKKVIDENNDRRKNIIILITIILVVGNGLYTKKKIDQYGGAFDTMTLLFY